MKTETKSLRILQIVGAISIAALVTSAILSSRDGRPDAAVPCDPMHADVDYFGPRLTPAQIEAIPSSSEWNRLKGLLLPGDSVHQYSWRSQVGHIVLRNKCLIGRSNDGIV